MIITIDGPAASGKTSLSDSLSKRINFKILHSGLIYRAIAKKLLDLNFDISLEEKVYEVAQTITLEDTVNKDLFLEEIGNVASKIAKFSKIRSKSNSLQREFVNNNKNTIIEGRDAGTAVFPEADLKIYIDASPHVRAQRRFNELQEKGIQVIYHNILAELVARDKEDSNRINSPMKMAEGAILIDTSKMNKEESLNYIASIVQERLLKNK